MFPLQALQQERAHKALSAKDVVERAEKENRPMTADEVALFDKLKEQIDALDTQIKGIQTHADRRTKLEATLDELAKPAGTESKPQPVAAQNTGTRPAIIPHGHTRPMRAFPRTAEGMESAYRSGMWLRAAILGDQRAAHWCLNHGVGTDIRNALGENVNSAGGYLVPEEFSSRIIDLRESYSVFRQNCFVQQMGRDTMVVPRRLSGVSITAVGENPASAITQSQPAWNQVRLTAKKAGGLCLMSSEVSEDAVIDLADMLADEFAYAFGLFEDQCGFIGTGTSAYLGIRGITDILKAGQSLAGAVDAASAHDTFAEIDATDLQTAMAKLPEYARMGAKWYCSAVCLDMVFGRLMAGAGGNTIQDMQGGYGRSYMGYPIVVSQVLPTATTDLSDVAMLLFGDLKKSSTLGDRRDMRVFPSEHRYMDTDQIGVRATCRFDIVNHDYGDATNAGPIVALVGE
jgi:HK97 family phage major capsid protein